MQGKMKVSFSETGETSMKRFCFLGHVLNCPLSADNAKENVNSELSCRPGIMKNVSFLINCARITCYNLGYALSFP